MLKNILDKIPYPLRRLAAAAGLSLISLTPRCSDQLSRVSYDVNLSTDVIQSNSWDTNMTIDDAEDCPLAQGEIYYVDLDGDGYGSKNYSKVFCSPPASGWVLPNNISDCVDDPNQNPLAPYINPGAQEKCNDIDDNCNGLKDEGLNYAEICTPAANGICATVSDVRCVEGEFYHSDCQSFGNPSTELCDNLDNDCDGLTDEDFPSLDEVCSVGFGVCASYGNNVCSQDKLSIICDNYTHFGEPSLEVCDDKDNDCDGLTDEDLTSSCYTGPEGTLGLGECKSGWKTCLGGTWGRCEDEYTPQEETCDGLDNDCDGNIDISIHELAQNSPLAISIIIDNSGSIKVTDAINLRYLASKSMVNSPEWHENISAAVTAFASSYHTFNPLTNDKPSIINDLELAQASQNPQNLYYSGESSNINYTLMDIIQELSQNQGLSSEVQKVIILESDGADSDPNLVDAVNQSAYDNNISICALNLNFFGWRVADYFAQLTDGIGGFVTVNYYHPSDEDSVFQAFKGLIHNLSTYTLSTCNEKGEIVSSALCDTTVLPLGSQKK